ncbi:MAG TPA: hypothetical protein ENI11_04450 [Actinobacteria bacterium]|nr:hypothetical protein [Actinomycetota bacterium]
MKRKVKSKLLTRGATYLMSAILLLSMVAAPAMAVLAGKNTVDSAAIINHTIRSQDIRNGALTTDRIAAGAVRRGKIATGAVRSYHIIDGGVWTRNIKNLAVTNAKLAANAVTADKIADNAVTNAKLGADVMVMRLGSGFTAGDTMVNGTMSFNATYTTGGVNVSPSGLTTVTAVMIVPSKEGIVFEVDETSFAIDGSFNVEAWQTGDTTGGPLGEVTAGTDLSAITGVRYLAIGQ